MEIQIFFIHFSYIQMIAEFNSYMSNIDIDFFKELCLKHGELRHYKKNEFILHEGCLFFLRVYLIRRSQIQLHQPDRKQAV